MFRFFRHLRNVSLEGDINKPNIEFTADGDLKSTELKIMNLRPSVNSKNIVWEEVRLDFSLKTQYMNTIFTKIIDWCLEIMGNTKVRYS